MPKKIQNTELVDLGFHQIEALKTAGQLAKQLIRQKTYTKEEVLTHYKALIHNPDQFLDTPFAKLAQKIKELGLEKQELPFQEKAIFNLQEKPLSYQIYGASQIEAGALRQMDAAMRLPISVAGALMPDAHQGYGLPIGGVLATKSNIVIPYAVGVDIACRMCLSIFPIEAPYLEKKRNQLKNLLLENTQFGLDGKFNKPMADDVFDKPEWHSTKVIRSLRNKAIAQVGTSGTGNHFVEWGILELESDTNDFNLPKGQYLALLSHSGSRGFGANIADHYSKLAMKKTKLPAEAKHLAWLDLHTEEGQEYWIGMNLAGDYASANHHQIHKRMSQSLEQKPILMIENHHNFAWKEKLADGTEVMVHRKGATPAGEGVLGIIPGSMTQPGFVVKGKGKAEAIFSASHGAGRKMSRAQAFKSITQEDVKRELEKNNVLLLGSDLDEGPMAYKDINQVMQQQQDLVEVIAKFTPKIVRMAEVENHKWQKKKKGLNGE